MPATQKQMPEQVAQHTYKRASLTPEERTARQQRQQAPTHSAGHFAGIHPEDVPRTTEEKWQYPAMKRSVEPITFDENEEAEDRLYPQTRSSARRYKNALPERARTQAAPLQTSVQEETQKKGMLFHPSVLIGAVLASMALAILGAAIIPQKAQELKDNAVYGYPRITRAVANVGHGNAAHPDSRFLGINLDGTIEVIEFPASGDNPYQNPPHVYVVTHLSSLAGDPSSVPVDAISFQDVSRNGKPEMIVDVNGNEYIFSNDGKTFKEQ